MSGALSNIIGDDAQIIGGDGIGDVDIIGDDELSLQQAEQSPGVAKAIAARAGVAVVHRRLRKVRRMILPFPTVTLGPANSATAAQTVSAQPQVVFKGKRLIIPSDIAGVVVIDDIKVGMNSQLVTGGGAGAQGSTIPGRAFSEVAEELILDLDTAQVNNNVTLNARNTSGGQVTFNAALFGIAVMS